MSDLGADLYILVMCQCPGHGPPYWAAGIPDSLHSHHAGALPAVALLACSTVSGLPGFHAGYAQAYP